MQYFTASQFKFELKFQKKIINSTVCCDVLGLFRPLPAVSIWILSSNLQSYETVWVQKQSSSPHCCVAQWYFWVFMYRLSVDDDGHECWVFKNNYWQHRERDSAYFGKHCPRLWWHLLRRTVFFLSPNLSSLPCVQSSIQDRNSEIKILFKRAVFRSMCIILFICSPLPCIICTLLCQILVDRELLYYIVFAVAQNQFFLMFQAWGFFTSYKRKEQLKLMLPASLL